MKDFNRFISYANERFGTLFSLHPDPHGPDLLEKGKGTDTPDERIRLEIITELEKAAFKKKMDEAGRLYACFITLAETQKRHKRMEKNPAVPPGG